MPWPKKIALIEQLFCESEQQSCTCNALFPRVGEISNQPY